MGRLKGGVRGIGREKGLGSLYPEEGFRVNPVVSEGLLSGPSGHWGTHRTRRKVLSKRVPGVKTDGTVGSGFFRLKCFIKGGPRTSRPCPEVQVETGTNPERFVGVPYGVL